MNDAVELGLLAGRIVAAERELRLMRLQLEQIVSSVGLLATGLPQRLGSLEQLFHGLAGELSHGLGLIQQQQPRQEARFDALDAGLTALRTGLEESTARIIATLGSPH
jgi:hypothetical protein